MRLEHLVENFETVQTVLHLTCVGNSLSAIDQLLDEAKERKIRNLFVLRGDQVQGDTSSKHFNNANELVSHIRARFGSQFTICVAGYPGTVIHLHIQWILSISRYTRDLNLANSIVRNRLSAIVIGCQQFDKGSQYSNIPSITIDNKSTEIAWVY